MKNTFRDSPTPDMRSFRVEKVAAPLRHSVTESIRNGIALGYFKAGDRLPERTLCEMTGVSRTLVREALRQLESEGIIEVLPNRGPIVSVLSVKEAEDIYRVRVELEGLASELFALHASDEDRQRLSAAFDNLKKSMENPDPLERLKAKNWFYDCLFEGSGNKALGASLKMLNSRIVLLRATSLQAPGRTALSVEELHTLVDALLAKNATEARRAAVVHVQNAAEVAVKLLRDAQGSDTGVGPGSAADS